MKAIATRYAYGLVKLAEEVNQLSTYKNFMKQIDDLFVSEPLFYKMLRSAFVNKQERLLLIEQIFAGKNWEHMRSFIALLIDNRRLGLFHQIRKQFDLLVNQKLNIKEGIVYSIEPLTSMQITSIEKQVSAMINQEVILKNEIDQKLIGGIKIFVGGRIYDYSINMKLESLRDKLLKRGA